MLDGLMPQPPHAAAGWTLPEIIHRLRSAYCGTLAVEFDHVYSLVGHRAPDCLRNPDWSPKVLSD